MGTGRAIRCIFRGVLAGGLTLAAAGAWAQAPPLPPFPEKALPDATKAFEGGDDRRALTLLRPRAEAGDAKAQYGMGYIHLLRGGGPGAMDRGAAWLARAAEQGLPEAQLALGIAYERGLGVARDPGRAAALYRKAAEHGQAAAATRLGALSQNGWGMAPDPKAAAGWYRHGVELGDPEAAWRLGGLFALGLGVERSPEQAFTLRLQAAEAGYGPAQFEVAQDYAWGVGTGADPDRAVTWYSMAGFTALREGRRGDADRALARLLELAPRHERTRSLQRVLEGPEKAPRGLERTPR